MRFDFTKKEWEEIIDKSAFADDELKVLELYRRGWCYITIAEELYISETTVKRKMKRIKNRILRIL